MTDERFATLMSEFRAPLLRYLQARGAGDAADDIVQEIWLKVDTIDLQSIGEPRAYIYRVAHNLMVDRARRGRRRASREHTFQDLHGLESDRSLQLDAERSLIAREHLDRIDRALADMGARTDMIFRRHRVDGVPQRQIAHELGVSLSAIEKQLQKAYRAVAAAERAYQAETDEQREGSDERG